VVTDERSALVALRRYRQIILFIVLFFLLWTVAWYAAAAKCFSQPVRVRFFGGFKPRTLTTAVGDLQPLPRRVTPQQLVRCPLPAVQMQCRVS
jgi:hypothetical protein